MKIKKFKEGDIIKREFGKLKYRFISFGSYGKFGDMRVEQMESNHIYTVHSHRGGWRLAEEESVKVDLFPIY